MSIPPDGTSDQLDSPDGGRADDGVEAVQRVLDPARSAVIAIDTDEVITYVNPHVEVLLGWPPDELVGRNIATLIPPRHHEALARLRDSYLAAPHAARVGYSSRDQDAGKSLHALRKDGTQFPVEVRLTPVPVRDTTWILVAVDDVTAQVEAEHRLERLNRAYLTLAQLNQAIVRAPDELSLYAEACRVAVQYGGYIGAFVGKPDGTGRVRIITTAGSIDSYIHALDLVTDPADPRGSGPTARSLRTGTPYYTSRFLEDAATAPWHASAEKAGIASSATLPLLRDGRPVAVLCLYSATPDVFDDHMRALLEQLRDNVMYALKAFAAHDRLEAVLEQRTDLLRRLVNAQEAERARIAGDVHDEPVQALAAADLRLGLLERQLGEDAPHLHPRLQAAQDAIALATSSLRQLLFELEPPTSGLSCADAVREAAAHIFEHTATQFELIYEDDVHLPAVEQLQALRIVKEALINIRKHAAATHARVHMRNHNGGVHVTIHDNGTGLTPPDEGGRRPGHRGLETMRDRAAATGGWCTISDRGTPGPPATTGTQVDFWIPENRTNA